MTVRPRVSVVIPAYNAGRYLAQSIDSVISQTVGEIQLIVIDDGSTDDTRRIANSYTEIEYYFQENGGIGSARNTGVTHTTASWIAFLDGDDVWSDTKLEKQLSLARRNPDAKIIYSMIEQFLSPDLPESESQSLRCPAHPQSGICASAAMVHREAWEAVGPFDQNIRTAEFIDWHNRAIDEGLNYVVAPETLVKRRIHSNNTGRRDPSSREDYVSVIKNAIERRRGRGIG